MSAPQHQAYKPSGVEWLGDIPSHWEVVRIGSLFREVAEEGGGDLPTLSVSIHDGVSDKEVPEEEMQRKVTRSEDRSKYKRVVPGDLVYNMMRAWQGGFGTVTVTGQVSPAYVVARPRAEFPTRFIELLLRTPPAIEEMRRHSYGVTDFRLRLYWDAFKNISVPFPSISQQEKILRFLDSETAKIDALVAEQEQLVELLKEKRQAVISNAVTKGLDPTVPMKDSGIDWFGHVPEHWKVTPFGWAIGYQEGPGILAVDFHDDGVPLIRVSGVQGRWVTLSGCNYLHPQKVQRQWNHFRLVEGDLVISASASMGMISEVGEEAAGAIPYTGLIRLWPIEPRITRDYIRSIMECTYFLTQAELLRAGATIQHFGPTHLSQMKIVVPPVEEQLAISRHILEQSARIESLVTEAQHAIELLKERRSALISAAVTGKIAVRGFVDTYALEPG